MFLLTQLAALVWCNFGGRPSGADRVCSHYWGFGGKPQPPTTLVHFEDLETLGTCALFYAHDSSTELTEFCVFRVAKKYCTPLSAPPLLVPGDIYPLCPPYPPPLFVGNML